MPNRLMLIDGNSLIYRAFYALPVLKTKNGEYTNAIFGFLSMFFNAYEQYKPTHVLVAFDSKEQTFRHTEFDEYKAGRKPMPEELVPQVPLLRRVLKEMNITACNIPGYEADDIIGTLSRISDEEGGECLILSGDRDVLQLISDKTTVLITRKGISNIESFDKAHLHEVYQLEPDQIRDLKGLMGDSSDNIPGIPGVGEKTALNLLHEYGTVEAVISNAANIKGKLGEKIAANADLAIFSKRLATIERNVPLEDCSFESCRYTPVPAEKLRPLFQELEFKTLFARLQKLQENREEVKEVIKAARQEIVTDEAKLQELISKLQSAEEVAIYFSKEKGAQAYFSLCAHGEQEYKVLLCNNMIEEGVPYQQAISLLGTLCNGSSKKILYHAKELMHILAQEGQQLSGEYEDIMIAEYLLDSVNTDYSLQKLIEKYEVNTTGAAAVLRIFQVQKQEIQSGGLQNLYKNIEMPLIQVLFDMEKAGFSVDDKVLRQLGAEYTEAINKLTSRIYELSGGPFNINSPKQLGDVLFVRLGLPAGKKTKTGYSTDNAVLENLRDKHEIIPLLIDYRQAQKFQSTYIDGLLSLIGSDNRIHSTFNQTVAATGRISSTEPNLQNIPIRTEYGRSIRKAFVAEDDNWVLIDADYSQIELRILAHLSDDPVMIDAFNKGLDIHASTASEVFRVPLSEVSSEQRSAAKAVNFGIVYGISDFGLAQNIGISRKQAAEYIEGYFRHYPNVKTFMDNCIAEAKATGYSTTMFGRRRPMPELQSSNYNVRSFGERVAINTPVQGAAADIIKLAMISVHNQLQQSKLKAKLILQVHDELLIEAPQEEAEQVMQLLKDCMTGVVKLKVPLVVDIKQGRSWYETK